MVSDRDIEEIQKAHGYDWHSAYLTALLRDHARNMAAILFPPRQKSAERTRSDDT